MAKVQGCDLSKIGKFGRMLDFYYWKGILCVRKYPKKARQPGTPAQKETWQGLRFANAEFNSLAQQERDAFKFLSSPSQMSGRDLYLKMILEEYQARGESLCRLRIRAAPETEDAFRITLTKDPNAPVLLAGLTPKDKVQYLYWEEAGQTLRGKRLLRRWDLVDRTENGTALFFIPKEATTFNTLIFYDSGVRFLTARAVLETGGGYGRAGLYEVAFVY